jgi:hypothetical protein
LRAVVRDSGFLKRNGATVSATVTGSAGAVQELPLEWAIDRDGEYTASVVPTASGVQEIHVRAIAGGDTAYAPPTYVRVAEPVEEFFGAERRDALLEQLARETGGRTYAPAQALEVARDLRFSSSGATAVRRLDLWDAPLALFVLLTCLGGEWVLRRRRGLT